jgi:hypothetical protein
MEVLDPPDPVGLRPEVNSNDRHRIAQYICIVNLCRYYSVTQAGPRPPPGVGVVLLHGVNRRRHPFSFPSPLIMESRVL